MIGTDVESDIENGPEEVGEDENGYVVDDSVGDKFDALVDDSDDCDVSDDFGVSDGDLEEGDIFGSAVDVSGAFERKPTVEDWCC